MIAVVRTDQLLNTLLIRIRPRRPEARALVCVRAEENRYLGQFAGPIAELQVLGDEDAVDCGEPF